MEKGTDHALILDLYAEKDPHYDEGRPGAEAYGDEEEFDKTPWLDVYKRQVCTERHYNGFD